MYPTVSTIAVMGYVCATGLALAYLVQREELIYRLAFLATLAGWAAHTVSLIVQAVEQGRPPLGTLSEAVSVAVWVVVLLEMWIERQYAVKVLGDQAHRVSRSEEHTSELQSLRHLVCR